MLILFTAGYKTIGILGGIGPEATSDLYMRITKILQSKGAKYDYEFPPIFIYSLPLPDIIENIKSEKIVISMLIDAVKKLENAGASFIVIACNSVFSYIKEMQSEVSVPIPNIMEETAKEISKKSYKKVGLLGTKITIRKRLFDDYLKKYNIKTIKPTRSQQVVITKIIINVLSGKKLRQDTLKLKSIIDCLQKKGAEAVILGCTELPLILSQKDVDIELFDTTEIIAKVAINKATIKADGLKARR